MQLDTALHVIVNRSTYPEDQVQTAAMTISAEMVTHPRLLGLLQQEKDTKYNTYSLPQLADEYGLLKAEEKENKDKQEAIKTLLHVSGEKQIDGNLYHVTIGEDYINTTISLVELKKKNPKLYDQLKPHIKETNCIGRVLARAR